MYRRGTSVARSLQHCITELPEQHPKALTHRIKRRHSGVQPDIARMVQTHPIKSEIAICHIRQANVGDICLANTHPFQRELWGRYWTFAHNDQINQFDPRPGLYEPVGTTDSEALFCDLMNAIRSSLEHDVDLKTLTQFLVKHSDAYSKQGVFNLLLSNGDWQFTYCTTKVAAITRRSPFGPARLQDADLTVDFGTVTTPSDVVSVFVTEPLTVDERWERYEPHEWRMWRKGEMVERDRHITSAGPPA